MCIWWRCGSCWTVSGGCCQLLCCRRLQLSMTAGFRYALALGGTPSFGSPPSNSALNTELNNVARNSDNIAKARALVRNRATHTKHFGHTYATIERTRPRRGPFAHRRSAAGWHPHGSRRGGPRRHPGSTWRHQPAQPRAAAGGGGHVPLRSGVLLCVLQRQRLQPRVRGA